MKIFKKNFFSIVGFIGSLCILFGYFLLMNGKIEGISFEYIFLNILGSLFLSIELSVKKAFGTLFLQIILIGISVYGLVKYVF